MSNDRKRLKKNVYGNKEERRKKSRNENLWSDINYNLCVCVCVLFYIILERKIYYAL